MKKKVLSFVMAVTMIVGCLTSRNTAQAATVKLEEPKIGLALTDSEDSLYAKITFSGNCMTKSTLAYRKHQKKQNTKYVFSGIGKSKIANGYKIQRKKNNGKYTTIKTVKLTKKKSKYYLNLTYKDSAILRGNTYTYRVVLYKTVGTKTILKKSLTKQITVKKIEENIEPDDTPTTTDYDFLTEDQMKHYNDGFEPKMLKVINQYRAEKGLKPMVLDTRLCEAARQRLVEELQEDEIGNPTGVHMRPNYRPFYNIFTPLGIQDIAPRGENWVQTFDEIIGCGLPSDKHKKYMESWFDWYSNPLREYYAYSGGWDVALRVLLDSPGHYEIMMGELNDCFGAAFVQKGRKIYWMQECGTYGTNYFYGED